MLSVHYATEKLTYTGVELRPHFLLQKFGLKGSAVAAFRGPCQVETVHLVDWEDRLANDRIEATEMVHFLGEFFGPTLREAVLAQRLFMAILGESLREKIGAGKSLWREGDDLFMGDAPGSRSVTGAGAGRKLSVSIVTASPVSQLLHIGINVDPAGAPVPAVGLKELGVDPESWARDAIGRFQEEWNSLEWACAKVRPVM
jgi:hypothetical protein